MRRTSAGGEKKNEKTVKKCLTNSSFDVNIMKLSARHFNESGCTL